MKENKYNNNYFFVDESGDTTFYNRKGEMRYYNFLKDKFGLIVDLYDFKSGWKNFYSKKNPFDIKKISPLRLGI